MNRTAPKTARFTTLGRQILLALMGFGCTLPAMAGISIPNTPLQSGSPIPANITVLIDDSGSMYWRYLYIHNADASFPKIAIPKGVDGASSATTSSGSGDEVSNDNFGACGTCVVTGDASSSKGGYNQTKYMVDKSSATNGLYYNPSVTYTPWYHPDGTQLPGVSYNAVATHHEFANYSYTSPGGATISTTSASVDLSGYINTYYVLQSPSADRSQASNYYRFQILPDGTIWRSQLAQTNTGNTAGKGCNDAAGAAGTVDWRNCTRVTPTGRTETAEKQNFANWYTFYETRIKTAKASLTAAFSNLGILPRVGFRTIWNRNNSDIPVGTDNGLFEDKASPATNNKTKWFNSVVNAIASSGTPLRSALASVGSYYSQTSASGPYGPESGSAQLSCRQNFTILTTDGYWNQSYTDSTVGTADNGAPYPFGSSASYTLADVAYYYWKNDLRPDLTNNVPTSTADPANWQHMTLFTISIGAHGTLDPATVLNWIATNTPFTWPVPTHDQVTTIDDLFHAAINGHGKFVIASNPTDFVNALVGALDTIAQRTSASSNVSVSGARLTTTSQLFQSNFIIGKWTGDLGAYPISTGGVVSSTPTWLASQHIPTWNARPIYTWNGSAGVSFPTAAQTTALGGANVADYIRGDQSKEQSNGGSYRNRSSILGDMIDSSPVYQPADTSVVPSTPAVVYVGGNDGMLHAFNGSTGVEMFDYVPAGVNMSNLQTLANPNYAHQYFVDGSIVVSTKKQTTTPTDSTGKNILVGVLGRGGNTVYALDVSDPANFNATKVLWEYQDADMGNSLGTPVIARMNTGDPAVIIGNGYNSASGHSVFYVLNIRTGALIAKLDTKAGDNVSNFNGMATPKGWDADRNGTVDTIYGGDLLGNMWEWDVSDSNPANWGPEYGTAAAPQPFYVAKDAGGNRQPITSGLTIGLNPVDFSRWIFFGTGSYLTNGDPTNKNVQSWYAMQDPGPAVPNGPTQITGRAMLKQRSIVTSTVVNGNTVRAFGAATSGDMAGYKGWYVDWNYPSAQGERIVSDSTLLGNILLAASIIPSNNACDVGGSGFINAIDAFTGGAVTNPFFDINGDGVVNSGDTITAPGGGQLAAGSIDLGVGMPSLPVFIQKVITTTGSSGNIGQVIVSTPTNSGRISWREILIGN
ncbi:MAG: pilus assembly protein [Proteobacteria bacterium]|nr:pilus assembly protein [Pseudomonadota bacterium]